MGWEIVACAGRGGKTSDISQEEWGRLAKSVLEYDPTVPFVMEATMPWHSLHTWPQRAIVIASGTIEGGFAFPHPRGRKGTGGGEE